MNTMSLNDQQIGYTNYVEGISDSTIDVQYILTEAVPGMSS